jgi:hypothetical protein
MANTIVQFDLIRLGENDYYTDPTSTYIFGYINLLMLEELMNSPDYINDMLDDLKIGECRTVTLEVWEDMDDDKTWLDYKVLPKDYEVMLP